MNERVKEIRLALGLSQEEFGDKLGITKSSVSKIEKGTNGTTEQTIRSICREFGASYLWLTTGAGEMFEDIGEDAAFHAMIDKVLASEHPRIRAIFKSLSSFSEEDWAAMEKVLEKLLAGWEPWNGNDKED